MRYQNKPKNIFASILGMILFIAILVGCFFISFYLLIVGAVLGGILFLVSKIRQKFGKSPTKATPPQQHIGRDIDQED